MLRIPTSSRHSLAGGLNGPPFFLPMNDNSVLKQAILELAEPIVESLGLRIWGLDIIRGPRTKVCLYVDVPAQNGQNPSQSAENAEENPFPPKEKSFSANIDQCEEISRRLGFALDMDEMISGPWNLEVSSPGLERKFFEPGQMRPFIGDLADVRLLEPLDSFPDRRSWRGILRNVEDGAFELEPCSISGDGEICPDDEPLIHIPWSKVKSARRLHIFDAPRKPGKKKSGKSVASRD